MTHGDVPDVYVKGQSRELIYMKAPQELNVEDGKVLKLLKPLYGLKHRDAAGTLRSTVL